MIRLSKLSRPAGFSLVEMMVVLVITGIVSGALYQMLYAGRRSHEIEKNQIDMQQNARIAISSITDDFRHVSYGKDPTQPSIRYAGPDSIVYIADLMPEVSGAEVISYYLSRAGDPDTPNPNDTVLMKAVADSGGVVLYSQPQSYGIAHHGLSLRYFNGTGTELASPVPHPELIGEMMCTITATAAEKWKRDPYQNMTLSSTVYPRNLPLTPARSRPCSPGGGTPTYPNCNSVTMTWTTPTQNTDGTALPLSDISHFNFYFGTDPSHMNLNARLARNVNTWTVTGLGCDSYWISVTCVSRSGVESYPCERQASVTGGLGPKAPTSFTAIDSSGVKLMWSPVTQFTDNTPITVSVDYNVYRSTSSGFIPGDGNRITVVHGSTFYHDAIPNTCATYYYAVSAQVCCVEGSPSAEIQVDRPSPPQCPTNFAGTSGVVSGQMTVTWTHPTLREDLTALPLGEISATRVYYDTLQGNTSQYATLSGNASTMNLTGLQGCKTYYIHGRTIDQCGHLGSSSCLPQDVAVRMVQPCDAAIPVRPAGLALNPLDERVDLTWNPDRVDCDLAGYKIYYGTSTGVYNGAAAHEGASPIQVTADAVTNGNTCNFSLTTLDACQTYYVAVTSIDRCSPPHESPYSAEVHSMTVCVPCQMAIGCASWITTPSAANKDMHLELYSSSGSDETLAKLILTYAGTAKITQVAYGRPLALIWKSDGTAGQDGNIGPQGSGVTLNVTDVTVNGWTSTDDGIPMAVLFDSDVRDVHFDVKLKNPHGGFCTSTGTVKGGALYDDFDDGDYNGWTVRSGTWSVNNGELYQSSTSQNRMMIGSTSYGDITYESKIKVTSGTNAFLIFRYTDDNNFYAAGIKTSTDVVQLVKMRSGTQTVTATHSNTVDNNLWYNLKVVLAGTRARVYLDCVLVLDFSDAQMNGAGKVGFRTATTATRWDDVRLQPAAVLP